MESPSGKSIITSQNSNEPGKILVTPIVKENNVSMKNTSICEKQNLGYKEPIGRPICVVQSGNRPNFNYNSNNTTSNSNEISKETNNTDLLCTIQDNTMHEYPSQYSQHNEPDNQCYPTYNLFNDAVVPYWNNTPEHFRNQCNESFYNFQNNFNSFHNVCPPQYGQNLYENCSPSDQYPPNNVQFNTNNYIYNMPIVLPVTNPNVPINNSISSNFNCETQSIPSLATHSSSNVQFDPNNYIYNMPIVPPVHNRNVSLNNSTTSNVNNSETQLTPSPATHDSLNLDANNLKLPQILTVVPTLNEINGSDLEDCVIIETPIKKEIDVVDIEDSESETAPPSTEDISKVAPKSAKINNVLIINTPETTQEHLSEDNHSINSQNVELNRSNSFLNETDSSKSHLSNTDHDNEGRPISSCSSHSSVDNENDLDKTKVKVAEDYSNKILFTMKKIQKKLGKTNLSAEIATLFSDFESEFTKIKSVSNHHLNYKTRNLIQFNSTISNISDTIRESEEMFPLASDILKDEAHNKEPLDQEIYSFLCKGVNDFKEKNKRIISDSFKVKDKKKTNSERNDLLSASSENISSTLNNVHIIKKIPHDIGFSRSDGSQLQNISKSLPPVQIRPLSGSPDKIERISDYHHTSETFDKRDRPLFTKDKVTPQDVQNVPLSLALKSKKENRYQRYSREFRERSGSLSPSCSIISRSDRSLSPRYRSSARITQEEQYERDLLFSPEPSKHYRDRSRSPYESKRRRKDRSLSSRNRSHRRSYEGKGLERDISFSPCETNNNYRNRSISPYESKRRRKNRSLSPRNRHQRKINTKERFERDLSFSPNSQLSRNYRSRTTSLYESNNNDHVKNKSPTNESKTMSNSSRSPSKKNKKDRKMRKKKRTSNLGSRSKKRSISLSSHSDDSGTRQIKSVISREGLCEDSSRNLLSSSHKNNKKNTETLKDIAKFNEIKIKNKNKNESVENGAAQKRMQSLKDIFNKYFENDTNKNDDDLRGIDEIIPRETNVNIHDLSEDLMYNRNSILNYQLKENRHVHIRSNDDQLEEGEIVNDEFDLRDLINEKYAIKNGKKINESFSDAVSKYSVHNLLNENLSISVTCDDSNEENISVDYLDNIYNSNRQIIDSDLHGSESTEMSNLNLENLLFQTNIEWSPKRVSQEVNYSQSTNLLCSSPNRSENSKDSTLPIDSDIEDCELIDKSNKLALENNFDGSRKFEEFNYGQSSNLVCSSPNRSENLKDSTLPIDSDIENCESIDKSNTLELKDDFDEDRNSLQKSIPYIDRNEVRALLEKLPDIFEDEIIEHMPSEICDDTHEPKKNDELQSIPCDDKIVSDSGLKQTQYLNNGQEIKENCRNSETNKIGSTYENKSINIKNKNKEKYNHLDRKNNKKSVKEKFEKEKTVITNIKSGHRSENKIEHEKNIKHQSERGKNKNGEIQNKKKDHSKTEGENFKREKFEIEKSQSQKNKIGSNQIEKSKKITSSSDKTENRKNSESEFIKNNDKKNKGNIEITKNMKNYVHGKTSYQINTNKEKIGQTKQIEMKHGEKNKFGHETNYKRTSESKRGSNNNLKREKDCEKSKKSSRKTNDIEEVNTELETKKEIDKDMLESMNAFLMILGDDFFDGNGDIGDKTNCPNNTDNQLKPLESHDKDKINKGEKDLHLKSKQPIINVKKDKRSKISGAEPKESLSPSKNKNTKDQVVSYRRSSENNKSTQDQAISYRRSSENNKSIKDQATSYRRSSESNKSTKDQAISYSRSSENNKSKKDPAIRYRRSAEHKVCSEDDTFNQPKIQTAMNTKKLNEHNSDKIKENQHGAFKKKSHKNKIIVDKTDQEELEQFEFLEISCLEKSTKVDINASSEVMENISNDVLNVPQNLVNPSNIITSNVEVVPHVLKKSEILTQFGEQKLSELVFSKTKEDTTENNKVKEKLSNEVLNVSQNLETVVKPSDNTTSNVEEVPDVLKKSESLTQSREQELSEHVVSKTKVDTTASNKVKETISNEVLNVSQNIVNTSDNTTNNLEVVPDVLKKSKLLTQSGEQELSEHLVSKSYPIKGNGESKKVNEQNGSLFKSSGDSVIIKSHEIQTDANDNSVQNLKRKLTKDNIKECKTSLSEVELDQCSQKSYKIFRTKNTDDQNSDNVVGNKNKSKKIKKTKKRKVLGKSFNDITSDAQNNMFDVFDIEHELEKSKTVKSTTRKRGRPKKNSQLNNSNTSLKKKT